MAGDGKDLTVEQVWYLRKFGRAGHELDIVVVAVAEHLLGRRRKREWVHSGEVSEVAVSENLLLSVLFMVEL